MYGARKNSSSETKIPDEEFNEKPIGSSGPLQCKGLEPS
jgi:hypothetical protein